MSRRHSRRNVLHMVWDIERRLDEERRLANERIEAARVRRRHVSAVRIADEPVPVFEVVIERSDGTHVYTIRKRSPSAWRLARLVGDSGRPLFNGGVVLMKGETVSVF